MKRKSMVLVGVAVAFLFGTAESCNVEPTAPKTGKVVDIAFDARACYDKDTETVLITYTPAGTDKAGSPWPNTVVCVTPEKAAKYKVGSTYP
jgi:hypothetical protein